MSADPLFSWRNRWFVGSVALVAAIAALSALFGFILLPAAEGSQFAGIWNAICTAAGVTRAARAPETIVQPGYQTTKVVVTPVLSGAGDAESIGRGATLALRCTMCHGARGLSAANTPNLAGQYAEAVYKELQDFKSGARASAVMQPLVTDLSDQDMRDLAAYYAYLPRIAGSPAPAPRLVASGAPMRGIAPCGACHGTVDSKPGAAWLEGQPAIYLKAQLEAFAADTRHNDTSEQMRNIARAMTPAEIDEAARYYEGR
jgi:cytochrome c553